VGVQKWSILNLFHIGPLAPSNLLKALGVGACARLRDLNEKVPKFSVRWDRRVRLGVSYINLFKIEAAFLILFHLLFFLYFVSQHIDKFKGLFTRPIWDAYLADRCDFNIWNLAGTFPAIEMVGNMFATITMDPALYLKLYCTFFALLCKISVPKFVIFSTKSKTENTSQCEIARVNAPLLSFIQKWITGLFSLWPSLSCRTNTFCQKLKEHSHGRPKNANAFCKRNIVRDENILHFFNFYDLRLQNTLVWMDLKNQANCFGNCTG